MPTTDILKKGSKGDAVKTMQTMLIACGFSCGPDGADGDFGKNTLAGLTAFQTANGLEATGVYDDDTRAALEKAHDEAVLAFDAAAIEQSGDNRNALLDARNALKKEIENAAVDLEYAETLRFKLNDPWYEDTLINEYQFNWN